MEPTIYDCLIIGGGQSGLAVAYYLRRSKLNYLILDQEKQAGAAWLHAWDSLKLFSPAEHSSLPGWMMPKGSGPYPTRQETILYLKQYEERYKFPLIRDTKVENIKKEENLFIVSTQKGVYKSKSVVSATGTWGNPYIPSYEGQENFSGLQLHSAQYQNNVPFINKSVLVVGGGNSGAQILADLSEVAKTYWVTLTPPKFLEDHIDGRYLFEYATKLYQAKKAGLPPPPKASLGDIVMVDSVKKARKNNILNALEPFDRFYTNGVIWENGKKIALDAIIWCTGFKPALKHLRHLIEIDHKGCTEVQGTQSKTVNGLWLVGYGSWTGFASATLIGVGRSARQTAKEITLYLNRK